MSVKEIIDDGAALSNILFFLLILGLITIGLTLTYKFAFASGKIEGCYIKRNIEHNSKSVIEEYQLIGLISYREDLKMGVFDNFDQAVEAASKINCPIKIGE